MAARTTGVTTEVIEMAPDNLTKVKGIGKVYQQRLNEAGIYTFAQIAEADPAKLAEIAKAIDAAFGFALGVLLMVAISAAERATGWARYEAPSEAPSLALILTSFVVFVGVAVMLISALNGPLLKDLPSPTRKPRPNSYTVVNTPTCSFFTLGMLVEVAAESFRK